MVADKSVTMSIRQAAEKTGLSRKTIRFYEARGLITPPSRALNGYRVYHQQQIDELTLLHQARLMGFTLEEARELVALFRDPARRSADVKAQTLKKINDIDRHIAQLTQMREKLLGLANRCPGDESADCPIIDSFTGCCQANKK